MWGIEDGDNDCSYSEFEMLWNIRSEMLSRKLDIPDGNAEAVRDSSKEMASGSRGNGELACDGAGGRVK